MTIKQISVFLENKPGSLAEATEALRRGGVNLRALCIADTRDFGILRLIADDWEKANAVLTRAGYTTALTQVLVAVVADDPGAMSQLLRALAAAQVSVEYTYAFLSKKEQKGAVVVLRVDAVEKAAAILHELGVELGDDELFS